MKKIFILLMVLVVIFVACILLFSSKQEENNKDLRNNVEYVNELYDEDWESDNKTSADKVYSIKKKDFYLYDSSQNDIDEDYRGIKLLEYDVYDDYDEIYYVLYDYTTDPSYYYGLMIEDESSNNLLVKDKEQRIIGGVISRARIKKQDLKSKINISVFEKDIILDKVEKQSTVNLDLKNDLEDVYKIDNSSLLVEGNLGNIKFKYIDSENLYYGTTEHGYSSELKGETYSIPVKLQYGNYLTQEEHIEFYYEKNVNNLTLEKAFEYLSLINENFGQYGLSDIYGLTKLNLPEDEVIVTFDEMMALCNGKSIEKDNQKYTKASFEKYAEMPMEKDSDVEIGNGITAIKYYFKSNKNEIHYMFVNEDKIYYITLPSNERIVEEVRDFLDSIGKSKE